ncbi:uncharacterized protein CLUP02_10720 [Colletotrichum lupini]|uniref:CsbD-like domain-containing protein n=1 Tax=Colletotrichum lupini TaxID=145971 RepID=A0A9Q8WIU0_9PEZI|nr:uncharacterized protein CLUP02_10720 [Colletotrichum lupini]UQC85223.1 hypothetical protein CLUP02_10720 [Colletotrichum lupini]
MTQSGPLLCSCSHRHHLQNDITPPASSGKCHRGCQNNGDSHAPCLRKWRSLDVVLSIHKYHPSSSTALCFLCHINNSHHPSNATYKHYTLLNQSDSSEQSNHTISTMAANNDNTSTLKSYVDSATGAAQNLLGSLTGSTADQNKGEAKQDKAQLEHDASHATAKIPGFTATAGGVTKDDPDRAGGSWNQTVGSAKETVGGLVGSENLKQQGREQNLQGQEQEAKGQLNDYTFGIGNRVQGTIGGAVAGLTGDKAGQAHYEGLHDTGKTQQRGAEHDIQKQAEAKQH